jgi:hypothetical protein
MPSRTRIEAREKVERNKLENPAFLNSVPSPEELTGSPSSNTDFKGGTCATSEDEDHGELLKLNPASWVDPNWGGDCPSLKVKSMKPLRGRFWEKSPEAPCHSHKLRGRQPYLSPSGIHLRLLGVDCITLDVANRHPWCRRLQ